MKDHLSITHTGGKLVHRFHDEAAERAIENGAEGIELP